jgi:hypothetical protein
LHEEEALFGGADCGRAEAGRAGSACGEVIRSPEGHKELAAATQQLYTTDGCDSSDSARSLTSEQYSALADVPPEVEWLANITNANTD